MDSQLIAIWAFFILTILVLIKNIHVKRYYKFLWYCDFTPLLFLIGFMTESDQFIKGLIHIGLIPQFVTALILIYGFVFRKDVIGVNEYIKSGKFHVVVELLTHIVPVNLALLLTYNIMPEKESLIYSLIILIIMFVLTILIAPKKDNINLIYNTDLSDNNSKLRIRLPAHTVLWIVYSFILAALTFLIELYIYNH